MSVVELSVVESYLPVNSLFNRLPGVGVEPTVTTEPTPGPVTEPITVFGSVVTELSENPPAHTSGHFSVNIQNPDGTTRKIVNIEQPIRRVTGLDTTKEDLPDYRHLIVLPKNTENGLPPTHRFVRFLGDLAWRSVSLPNGQRAQLRVIEVFDPFNNALYDYVKDAPELPLGILICPTVQPKGIRTRFQRPARLFAEGLSPECIDLLVSDQAD